MKKQLVGALVALVTSSTLFLATPAQAVPGTCSPEDPCDTYAVLGSNNEVTNIIVCQESVCGSGEFAGMRVAPQVQGDRSTGNPKGGYWGGPDNEDAVTYDETSRTFNIATDTPSVSETKTIDYVSGEVQTTVELKLESPARSGDRSFSYEDSVGVETVRMHTPEAPVTLTATLETGEVETITFDQKVTREEVEEEVVNSGLTVIIENIREFFTFSWLIDWFR